MAKKRKHHHRRRRVHGFGGGGKKSMGLKLLAVAGGYLMADGINAQIDKIVPKKTDTVTNTQVPNNTVAIAGSIGLGGLLLMRKGTGTTGMVTTIAGGLLAGAGLKRALKSSGIISGYQNVPVIGAPRMAGYQSTPVIGGKRPPQLAGRPAQLQGFRVNGYTPTGSGVMGSIGNPAGRGSGITTGSSYMQ